MAVGDPRDRRVLDLLMTGLTTREVAARMGCSHTRIVRFRHGIGACALALGGLPAPCARCPLQTHC